MTIFVLERVPAGVRGKLMRWMLEVRAGVFVGTPSARVREKLWQELGKQRRLGACSMIHHAGTEQGFTIASSGDTSRSIVDYDGLLLMRKRPRAAASK